MRPAQNQQPRQVWKDFRERMSDSLLQGHEMFASLPLSPNGGFYPYYPFVDKVYYKTGTFARVARLESEGGKTQKNKKGIRSQYALRIAGS